MRNLGNSPNDTFSVGLSEVVDDSVYYNAHQWGTSNEAFRLGGNKKLALYTNPAPVSAL